MEVHERSYAGSADLGCMRDLLLLGAAARIPASYMHPGELDWMTYYPPDEAANRRNLRLWEFAPGAGGAARGELAAWAIFCPLEETFDLFVHPTLHGTPTHAAVMAEYVVWAAGRARAAGLDHLSPFWVMDYDTVMDGLLKTHGFVPQEVAPPLFVRSLEGDLPPVELPPGYTVQGVRSEADGRLYAAVSRGAFRPDDDWGAYWARYARFMASPVYDGECHLVVRAPAGGDDAREVGAAVCSIWCDEVNGVGLFEPVATHPDFQRRGLGKAVMAEGLRRLQARGMRRVILGTDPANAPAHALYRSLGFVIECCFAFYRKELA
jgi:ribosomal protein S18 acetylase RimI-like enzyme